MQPYSAKPRVGSAMFGGIVVDNTHPMQNPQVSPGPATPERRPQDRRPQDRQEIILKDIFTDCPLTLSRENNDVVRLTYGGISRTTDMDASDLLLAAQMLSRDPESDTDADLLRAIMSYSNGMTTTTAFIERIKVILAPQSTPSPGGEGRGEGVQHTAKLYRVLDVIAAERARIAETIREHPTIELDLTNPGLDSDTKLRVLTIALGDIATTVDVADLSGDQQPYNHRPDLIRAELADKLTQLAAQATAWIESLTEDPAP